MEQKLTQADHGRKGGRMTSGNFAKNRSGASAGGSKSRRGPIVLECDWCDEKITKTNGKTRPTLKQLMDKHKQVEHPKLYAKFIKEQPR